MILNYKFKLRCSWLELPLHKILVITKALIEQLHALTLEQKYRHVVLSCNSLFATNQLPSTLDLGNAPFDDMLKEVNVVTTVHSSPLWSYHCRFGIFLE